MAKPEKAVTRDLALDLIERLGLRDKRYPVDTRLQHAIHVFAGYRAYLYDDEGNYYSPGSARDASFKEGRRMAEEDLRRAEALLLLLDKTSIIPEDV